MLRAFFRFCGLRVNRRYFLHVNLFSIQFLFLCFISIRSCTMRPKGKLYYATYSLATYGNTHPTNDTCGSFDVSNHGDLNKNKLNLALTVISTFVLSLLFLLICLLFRSSIRKSHYDFVLKVGRTTCRQ